jgi:hypothetical protein
VEFVPVRIQNFERKVALAIVILKELAEEEEGIGTRHSRNCQGQHGQGCKHRTTGHGCDGG